MAKSEYVSLKDLKGVLHRLPVPVIMVAPVKYVWKGVEIPEGTRWITVVTVTSDTHAHKFYKGKGDAINEAKRLMSEALLEFGRVSMWSITGAGTEFINTIEQKKPKI